MSSFLVWSWSLSSSRTGVEVGSIHRRITNLVITKLRSNYYLVITI
jgi:hypothetical protein